MYTSKEWDWDQEVSRDIYMFATLLFAMLNGAPPPAGAVAKTPKTATAAARKRESVRATASISLTGTRLGSYLVVSDIGCGAQGKVFLARDTRLDRMVTIKAYPSGRLRKREHEERVYSRLHHPHICKYLDAGQEHGVDYLVFEYLEGQTVAERLRKGPIPIDRVLKYAAQIGDAIQAMHRLRITHRDVSIHNVMLTGSTAKLIDFGYAFDFGVHAEKVKATAENLEKKREKRQWKQWRQARQAAARATKAAARLERLAAHAIEEAEKAQRRQVREQEKAFCARRKRRRALRTRFKRVAQCLSLWRRS